MGRWAPAAAPSINMSRVRQNSVQTEYCCMMSAYLYVPFQHKPTLRHLRRSTSPWPLGPLIHKRDRKEKPKKRIPSPRRSPPRGGPPCLHTGYASVPVLPPMSLNRVPGSVLYCITVPVYCTEPDTELYLFHSRDDARCRPHTRTATCASSLTIPRNNLPLA